MKKILKTDPVPFLTKESVKDLVRSGQMISADDYLKATVGMQESELPNWFHDVLCNLRLDYDSIYDRLEYGDVRTRLSLEIANRSLDAADELCERFEPQILVDRDGTAIPVPILYDYKYEEYIAFGDIEGELPAYFEDEVMLRVPIDTLKDREGNPRLVYGQVNFEVEIYFDDMAKNLSNWYMQDSKRYMDTVKNIYEREYDNFEMLQKRTLYFMNKPDVKEKYQQRRIEMENSDKCAVNFDMW